MASEADLAVKSQVIFQNSLADIMAGRAMTALSRLEQRVDNLGYGAATYTPVSPPGKPRTKGAPTAPTIAVPTLRQITPPSRPNDPATPPSVNAGTVPTNSATPPTFDFPNKPTDLGDGPTKPDVNLGGINFPEPPAELFKSLPSVPEFRDRAEPDAPNIILPDFEEREPANIADAPTDGEARMDAAYRMRSQDMQARADSLTRVWMDEHNPEYQSQMARIEVQLAKYHEGGTALNPAVEQGIYDRARERNDQEAERVRKAAYGEAASRGFTMPQGFLMAAVARARQEAANNNVKTNSEIIELQAKMEQDNLRFAVTTSAGLRQAMVSAALSYMQATISINGQAIDYAKAVYSNLIETYNASVRVYAARLDAYKGYVGIYEARLKAVLAPLEVFKAKVAVLELMTNVDKAKLDVYRAQIGSVESLVGLYRARIEGVKGQVELEKINLDIFREEVQAFGAQVQAKNAEWSGYTAAMNGEEAKVKIYATEVGAYNTAVDAFKADISAQVAQADGVLKNNAAAASVYSTLVEGFRAELSAESERSRAHNENNRQVLNAFDKEMTVYAGETNRLLVEYKAEVDAKSQNAQGNLSASIESARAKTQFGATLASLAAESSKIYAQMAGSALSGINALVAQIDNG